ncbi:MAG: ABC transporter substrate-binding protein [Hyphomicrobiales bacterium]|nr:MAG: ABC transporter substrate-binding protein [Hyphomicrobiales bacterium]
MSDTVSRRKFLKSSAIIGAAATATTLASPALAQEAGLKWKIVTSWPKNAPGVGVNAQRLADKITAMSNGELTVSLFGAGELVPPFEVFDAVSSGTAELGHATPYYWQGKDPSFHFFTGVPFGLMAHEHAAWVQFGGGQALWEKAYAPFGVVPFYAGSSGPQAGGWFSKELNSLEDFKGIKMRIAGLGGEVMRRIGVNTVLLPPGEIFAAMQSGAIDAAEWIGPWNDLAFGLYKVAKYYYMPAFHELGPALELTVNKAKYDALPDHLKEIIKNAAMASSYESLADFTYHNITSFKPLLEKEGVELRFLPSDVVDALGVQAEIVLKELGDSGPLAGEIYDSFSDFRAQATTYSAVSDQRAMAMRAQVLDK